MNNSRKGIGREVLNNEELCFSDLVSDVLSGRNYSRDDIRCLREQKEQIRAALLKVLGMVPDIRAMKDDGLDNSDKVKVVLDNVINSDFFCDLAKPVQMEIESVVGTKLSSYFRNRDRASAGVEKLKSSPDLVKQILVDDFDCFWPEGRKEEHTIGLNENRDAINIFSNAVLRSGKVGGLADCWNRKSVIKTFDLSPGQIANIESHENRHQFNNYLKNFLYTNGDDQWLWRVKDEIVAYLSQNKPRGYVELLTALIDFDGLYSYYRDDFDEEPRWSVQKEIYRKWLRHCRAVFKAITTYFNAKSIGENLNFDEMMMVPMNEWMTLIPPEKRRHIRLNSDYCLYLNPKNDDLARLEEDARVICNYLDEVMSGSGEDGEGGKDGKGGESVGSFLKKAGLGDPNEVVDIIKGCEIDGLAVDNYDVYSGIMILYIYTEAGVMTLLLCPTLAEIEKYEHPC